MSGHEGRLRGERNEIRLVRVLREAGYEADRGGAVDDFLGVDAWVCGRRVQVKSSERAAARFARDAARSWWRRGVVAVAVLDEEDDRALLERVLDVLDLPSS